MPIPDLSDRSLAELISLTGRTAVVTGGAKGIGRAIARRLAEAGAAVVIGDVDAGGAAATASEISAATTARTLATTLDVTSSASISETADAAVSAYGTLDIWVNNAGIYPTTPVLEMSDADWDHVIDVNLRGTFIGSREAARRMVDAGNGGVIVNLSSIAGFRGRGPGITHYVASKHGIRGITRQLAVEFAPRQIRVLGVAPTRIITPGVEAAMAGQAAGSGFDLDRALATPLGRPGLPDDVARVVLFCVSDLAAFMTGTTVLVDAGETAR